MGGDPGTVSVPAILPDETGCSGGPTWKARLCDCVCTVPGGHVLAAAGQTTLGSSAADPASFGICQTWPLCESRTMRYGPGSGPESRCGGTPGLEASNMAGCTTMVSSSVMTGGALPEGCG